MQFAVLTRANTAVNVPPAVAIGLAQKTFEQIAAGKESRIKAVYPFAGQRAGILIIEAQSGEELNEVIGSLPFFPIVNIEIHALGSVQSALKGIEQAQRQIAEMGPALAGSR